MFFFRLSYCPSMRPPCKGHHAINLGKAIPYLPSQAVNASQAQSQAATTTTQKADGGSKVWQTATKAHWASWVLKRMVKAPLMKLKFDL